MPLSSELSSLFAGARTDDTTVSLYVPAGFEELVRAGIPEPVAMQMNGHRTRSVFERYNIVSVGDLREAAKRLNAATGTISRTIEENRRSGSKV
jgi:hypothetical protein